MTKPVIGPRGGPFHFEYILPSGPPDVQAAAVLEALLDEYHRSGHAGVFEIIRTGSVFHVVPAMSRNALGELERYGSILDARISFPRQERSVGQMVDAIENAVSEATGSIVVGGLVPLRLFVETRVRDGADNEPARMVLLRTLNATRRKLSWRLLCGPGGPGAGSLPTARLPETRRCALNVHHVGEAEAQPGSMA